MDDNTKARLADEQADKLAAELAERTGLDTSRTGWQNIHVDAQSVKDRKPGPYLLITVANDCGHPTDEHGSFPFGVCVGAYSPDGEEAPNVTNPVLLIDGPEALRLGTAAVKSRLADALNQWKDCQAIQAAHELAADLAKRTGLHCVAEFTQAGTGSVNAYLHHPDTEGERHLQITVSTGPHPPVDERGAFPDGLAIFEVAADGSSCPHEEAPPLLSFSPEDTQAADADTVVDAMVGRLREWATRRAIEEATAPATGDPFREEGRVVLGDNMYLAWGPALGSGSGWLIATTDAGGVPVQVFGRVSREMLPVVLPIAAESARRALASTPF